MTGGRALLKTPELQELRAAALSLSDTCREAIKAASRAGIDASTKPDGSLVTNADLAAESAFRERLDEEFPDMGVLGEEFGHVRAESAWQWIIDPVDGTSDFAHGLPVWGTIIGLFYHQQPVVGVIDHPDLDLRVHAAFGLGAFRNGEPLSLDDFGQARDQEQARIGIPSRSNFIRRNGGGAAFDRLVASYPDFRVFRSCLTHAYAATGQLDAALEWDVKIWDLAATQIVIEEAGGQYIGLRERGHPGAGMLYCAVFGRPAVAQAISALLAGPGSGAS